MPSQMVARATAASSDPSWAYPAAKPAKAASVPHTSASPNRARHACHHPAGRPGTDGAAASALPAVTTATAATSMDTPLIAPPRFPLRRAAARFVIHGGRRGQLRLAGARSADAGDLGRLPDVPA